MVANHDKLDFLDGVPKNQVVSVSTLAVAGDEAARKRTERALSNAGLAFPLMDPASLRDEHDRPAKTSVIASITETAKRKRHLLVYASLLILGDQPILGYHDARGGRRWVKLSAAHPQSIKGALTAINSFEGKDVVLLPTGELVRHMRVILHGRGGNTLSLDRGGLRVALEIYSHGKEEIRWTANAHSKPPKDAHLTHLDRLEAESIHIIREVMAESENPVMLYSVGKDSSVMLHLARKAFYPSPPPFPLLHVDTRWKFQAMYDFRDYMAQESGMELLVHVNPDGVEKNINPLDHGSALHTDIMKTQSLKQALDHYRFDVAFGGARRDEEKSRAKERVFSFRTASHRWDPKNQRPELWNLYNGKKSPGESIRVFPISNWTELDIWQYIYREQIPIVPLYFAAERPVVERDGMLLMVDDNRLTIHPDEQVQIKLIRFRTLGCYPLTGAIESEADDLAKIVLELLSARTSERQGRAIDSDSSASMEKKKQEGYF